LPHLATVKRGLFVGFQGPHLSIIGHVVEGDTSGGKEVKYFAGKPI